VVRTTLKGVRLGKGGWGEPTCCNWGLKERSDGEKEKTKYNGKGGEKGGGEDRDPLQLSVEQQILVA